MRAPLRPLARAEAAALDAALEPFLADAMPQGVGVAKTQRT
jgi:hypothetical protein